MKLSQFKFNLPDSNIAKHPAKERHDAKLMVIDKKTGKIKHKKFKDILEIFNEDDVFVMNETKVFPARMYGNKEKTGARIEVFLMRELNKEQRLWDVQVDPARKIRVGNKLFFGNDELVAEVVDNTTSRGRTIKFLNEISEEEFKALIYKLGETPIPRYLGRDVENDDKERYQTIFAKNEGANAPPTAALHFSRELMMKLEIKGIKFAPVTLHIGQGAFREVEVEDLTKHKMDSEYMLIPDKTVTRVNNAIDEKKKIVAVGSSVMRALQSSVSSMDRLNPFDGWTDKFVFPPYEFKIANAYVTNFHPTESTLMMMAAAFAGYDLLMEAYQVAMKEKYKFLCYGDAMLII